jgi:hypothetical protein
LLSIDSVTRVTYDAAVTTGARAQTILDALTNPVTVTVMDGSDNVKGTGTMNSPWATRNNNLITLGELASFVISSNGTPDGTWKIRFSSGTRWVQGSFGLTGASTDFTWSQGTWATTQIATLGDVSTYVYKGAAETVLTDVYGIASSNRAPIWGTAPTIAVVQGTGLLAGNIAQYASDPDGDLMTFYRTGSALDTAPASITVSSSGSITVPANTPVGTYTVEVAADDGKGSTSWGITNTTLSIPINSLPKPAPLTSYIDPGFNGTYVKRLISPATVEVGNLGLKPFYSSLQAWNSDGTLLMLQRGNGYACILDASTYAVRIAQFGLPYPIFSTGLRWSPTEPNVIYYTGNEHNNVGVTWPNGVTPHSGAVFGKATINTSTWAVTTEVVGSFPQWPSLYKDGSWEQVVRNTVTGDLWVALQGRAANFDLFPFAYNITTKTAGPLVGPSAWNAFGSFGVTEFNVYGRAPDPVQMSPKGDCMIFHFGPGSFPGGKWKVGLDGVVSRRIEPSGGHADAVVDSSGVQWIVYSENGGTGSAGISKGKIDGNTLTTSVLLPGYISEGVHISGRNLATQPLAASKDYVIVSSEGTEPWSTTIGNEVMAVYLDSTTAVPHALRLCQTRSNGVSYSAAQSHATIKQDGTSIVFGSNWGDLSDTVIDAFVVDMPTSSNTSTVVATKAALLSPGAWSSAANDVGASTISTNAAPYNRPPFIALDPSTVVRNILDWPGKTMWDSQSNDWWFCGGPATQGAGAGGMTLVRYQTSTDTFRAWQGLTVDSDGIWYPYCEAHCFDAADIHVPSRRIYRRMIYRPLSGPVDGLGWFDVDTFTSGVIPMPAARDLYWTLCVHPGMGASGTVLVFNNYYNAQKFDIASGTFLTQLDTNSYPQQGGLSIYHSGYVYYTGGTFDSNNKFYRIDSAGTITTLGTTPVQMSNSYVAATGAILSSLGNYIYAFCGDGTIRRYDPAGNSWSNVGTMPWRFAGLQSANSAGALFESTVGKVITNPGTGEGVMLWISGTGGGQKATQTYLWKPT